MTQKKATFTEALRPVFKHSNLPLLDDESQNLKQTVQEQYEGIAKHFYSKSFLNWGLIDYKVSQEQAEYDKIFNKICRQQDLNSRLLIFNLLSPLIKMKFFNKSLLDVGCGNGIGTKISTVLLRTACAYGVDLTEGLVNNAAKNFHIPGSINFINGDAECLPFKDASFDIITNLESSHLYLNLALFFHHVFRILRPGGFFCYSDISFPQKKQHLILENFLKKHKKAKIIIKKDVTRAVQRSIYDRLIRNEESFLEKNKALLDEDKQHLLWSGLAALGLTFLPNWWIRFKHPKLKPMAKHARKYEQWYHKKYFYYLIQKQ